MYNNICWTIKYTAFTTAPFIVNLKELLGSEKLTPFDMVVANLYFTDCSLSFNFISGFFAGRHLEIWFLLLNVVTFIILQIIYSFKSCLKFSLIPLNKHIALNRPPFCCWTFLVWFPDCALFPSSAHMMASTWRSRGIPLAQGSLAIAEDS